MGIHERSSTGQEAQPIRLSLPTQVILKVFLEKPDQDRYGLELAGEARLLPGTIYPILARLERSGWVTSEWEEINESAAGRRRRRYYRLTGSGRRAALRALDETRKRISLAPAPVIQ